MKTVRKANRVLNVDDEKLDLYMRDGYDEIDGTTGKVVRTSPARRYTASEAEAIKAEASERYDKLLAEKDAEIERLKAQVEKLEKKAAKKPEIPAGPAETPAQNA